MALLLGLVLLFAPAIIYAESETCSESNLDADVLILGGGIAGISAAQTLHDSGVTKFLIIEAQSVIGGRLRTVELRSGSGIVINAGANWIQGYDPVQPELHPLVQIANTPQCGGIEGSLTDYDSIVVRTSQGVDISDSPILRYDDYELASAGIETLSKMRQSEGQPDITVRQALSENGWTPTNAADEWIEWLEFDYCFAEPPDNSSLFNGVPLPTYNDFGNPERTGDFLITDREGFFKVARCLADEFLVQNDPRLLLNTRVTQINWSSDCVCVTATDTVDGSNRTFCGKYAIVTFSIGVLQQLQTAGLEFNPPLPQDKVTAINKLRMTHYLNIVVEFYSPFWEPNIGFVGHVNETNGRYFPLIHILTHVQNASVVYITVTDTLADRIIRQTDEEIRQEIIAFINNAYNLTLQPSDIRTLFLPDWDINPLFLGSYSNIPLGVTDETFVNLRRPVENRLFFSGEATSQEYSGFVHGGYLSGIDTGRDVLAEIRNSGGRGVLCQTVNWYLLSLASAVLLSSLGLF